MNLISQNQKSNPVVFLTAALLNLIFRSLFVDEIKSSDRYAGFIPQNELDEYCKSGFFVGTGELIVSALSDRLKVPIVLIRSTLVGYVRPFIPTPCLRLDGDPIIFLACNVEDNRSFDTKVIGTYLFLMRFIISQVICNFLISASIKISSGDVF